MNFGGISSRMAEGQDDKANTFRDAERTAFVLGYTGETGKRLIKELAKDKLFKKVMLIGRREVELPSEFGPEFVSTLSGGSMHFVLW